MEEINYNFNTFTVIEDFGQEEAGSKDDQKNYTGLESSDVILA